MSYRVMGWVLDHARVERPSDLLVLLVLAAHADDDGGNAWPAVETIAGKTRLHERSVQRALRRLESMRVIVKTRPATTTRPATYRIVLPGGGTVPPDSVQERQRQRPRMKLSDLF